jgi:hypothetical protein
VTLSSRIPTTAEIRTIRCLGRSRCRLACAPRADCAGPSRGAAGAVRNVRPTADCEALDDPGSEVRRHVGESAVVALERQHDRVGRAVAMLRHYKVGLPCSRALALVGLLAVKQDDDVTILLD